MESIAAHHGCPSADDLYEHGDNEALRDARPSKAHLVAGDVVKIPEHEPQTFSIGPGQTKSLTVGEPRTKLRMKMCGADGTALSGKAFVVDVGGKKIEGTTDGDGMLEAKVPPRATEATVELTETKQRFVVRLGKIDPVDTPSGIASRLKNLGYLASDKPKKSELDDGIRRFRRDKDLDIEGGADSELQDSLVSTHGS